MGLPLFTCEIRPAGDPEWRKFSFVTADRRDRFMARMFEQGGEARMAELTRDDVPPPLRNMLPRTAA